MRTRRREKSSEMNQHKSDSITKKYGRKTTSKEKTNNENKIVHRKRNLQCEERNTREREGNNGERVLFENGHRSH